MHARKGYKIRADFKRITHMSYSFINHVSTATNTFIRPIAWILFTFISSPLVGGLRLLKKYIFIPLLLEVELNFLNYKFCFLIWNRQRNHSFCYGIRKVNSQYKYFWVKLEAANFDSNGFFIIHYNLVKRECFLIFWGRVNFLSKAVKNLNMPLQRIHFVFEHFLHSVFSEI